MARTESTYYRYTELSSWTTKRGTGLNRYTVSLFCLLGTVVQPALFPFGTRRVPTLLGKS